LPPDAIGVALEAEVPLRPSRMRLAVRAAVAGVSLHAGPQALDLPHPLVARGSRSSCVLPVLLLQVAEFTAQRGVLQEVAVIAAHGLLVALQRLLGDLDLLGESPARAVGLELRKRRFQALPRP